MDSEPLLCKAARCVQLAWKRITQLLPKSDLEDIWSFYICHQFPISCRRPIESPVGLLPHSASNSGVNADCSPDDFLSMHGFLQWRDGACSHPENCERKQDSHKNCWLHSRSGPWPKLSWWSVLLKKAFVNNSSSQKFKSQIPQVVSGYNLQSTFQTWGNWWTLPPAHCRQLRLVWVSQ